MHTQVCVVGTIATDPKLTQTAGKSAFCSFRLACNERRYDAEKKEWVDTETNWYTINSFRGLAEHAVVSFKKGDRVLISGRLRVRDWVTHDNKSGTSAVVEADALGHDLRWGTTTFKRMAATAPVDETTLDQASAGAAETAGLAQSAEAAEASNSESKDQALTQSGSDRFASDEVSTAPALAPF
ncbi:single-stranded DNA-binding protein [Leucobacter sp. HY1910]